MIRSSAVPVSGTYTVEFYDAGSGGNKSPTTATGYYTIIGNLCFVTMPSINNIDTTGMTATGTFYYTLPFDANSVNGASVGSVSHHGLALTPGSQLNPVINAGASRGLFKISGDSIADENLKVEDVTSADDILNNAITYRV